MAGQSLQRRFAMVNVGFIVEGWTDKIVVESMGFREWLESVGLCLAEPVVVSQGIDAMNSSRLSALLRKQSEDVERIVLLADLDPDHRVPCISERKKLIGDCGVDLVVIARKAIESWFLADTEAMRFWTGNVEFYEKCPEATPKTPWERLKEVSDRGPGRAKPAFVHRFTRQHGFAIDRAAKHPCCPSAQYFVERVAALGAVTGS